MHASWPWQFFSQMVLMSEIEVVFADNHPLTLSGLRSAVANQSDIKVLAECVDRERALDAVRNHLPDVLLLSAELLGEQEDALQQLVFHSQDTHVILLSDRMDPDFLEEVLRSGARGVFHRERPIRYVPVAIRKVTNGGLWFEQSAAERILDEFISKRSKPQDAEERKMGAVTAREQEVIELICQGLKNKEVSEKLHISEVTVSHHLTSIFRKLDVSDRISLILYCAKNCLVRL